MPENPRGIGPLDWQGLVDEALRRRKAEGMTQREHAALAGVSVPTIAAFDRAEQTLTLTKAFDILRIVGLIDEKSADGAQNVFVQESFKRWRTLVDDLPTDAPARFPHGWYRVDYCLEGDLRTVNLTEYEDILRQAVTRYTSWPVFVVMSRPELAPREMDGSIECWLAEPSVERTFNDAAHADFWRALPSGQLFLMRGYQEDAQDTFPPGTIFDATLPVWRLGEGLLHAEKLASLLWKSDAKPITVRFRAVYTGLSGRVLRSWANPLSDLLLEGQAARSDEAVLEVTVPAGTITDRLDEYLFPMIASLYERFGVTGLSVNRVKAETNRLLHSRMG
ncbi:helix-turn-helix transcriptional regulator [Microvirga puerhi]|uniref:Helix-turn-helix domain-containing protein n=1 Tax=Microvirga puerhi TaxID=2876078 RepID=A0ABS7VSG5_9HYPH|nr:helix-turn-helix transcriptional regulator [Microvirga puerhi]MBZ6078464.1 helix-turn-helix domain-containing protein [Microvirga puerhi]